MTADRPIVFRWAASSYFGWGIYGLNLMLHWPRGALTAQPIDQIIVTRDDQRRRVDELVEASRRFHERLAPFAGQTVRTEMPVFVSYGNDLERFYGVHQVDLFGRPNIGFVFLEDAAIDPNNVKGANQLALMVAGSAWNARVLAEAGVKNVALVLQGVDCELFQPRPRVRGMAGRFTVFSGGQLSIRKSQDLVLAAFRVFAERHSDALLSTAWHSPWPERAQSFAAQAGLPLPILAPDGALDVAGWAARAGISRHQFRDVGRVPNCELPAVLSDVDVALFPNRAEGGTNLIAMECLASGIPTILSANTGHLDLIERTGTVSATRQRPVAYAIPECRSTEGWGECDVEELVELLEQVYTSPTSAGKRAIRAAAAMQELSWERQIRRLYEVVSPML